MCFHFKFNNFPSAGRLPGSFRVKNVLCHDSARQKRQEKENKSVTSSIVEAELHVWTGEMRQRLTCLLQGGLECDWKDGGGGEER